MDYFEYKKIKLEALKWEQIKVNFVWGAHKMFLVV
jgi:hypothetical protein